MQKNIPNEMESHRGRGGGGGIHLKTITKTTKNIAAQQFVFL